MHVIKKSTEYAVMALVYMLKKGDLVSAAELAEQLGIPQAFLRRILRSLCASGFIESKRGQKGGFSPLKSATEITVFDLMEVFQGGLQLLECSGSIEECGHEPCVLREKLLKFETDFSRTLNDVSLDMLFFPESVKI